MAPLRLARLPALTAAYLLAVAVLVPAALSAQNGGITGSILNGSRVAGWGAASIDSTPLHSTEGLGLTTRLPGRDLPLLQDTVLSQRRMTVAMSGIALLTHLPIWGLVFHRDLGGDQGFTHRAAASRWPQRVRGQLWLGQPKGREQGSRRRLPDRRWARARPWGGPTTRATTETCLY